jgi:ribose 5-phosphate isomerase B
MRIYLGSDHRGFELKEKIKSFLINKAYEVEDLGALVYDPTDDYPVYAHAVAEAVVSDKEFGDRGNIRGIVFCGSAVGASIVANKVKSAWAGVVWNEELAKLSREHNNANILVLSADDIAEEEMIKIIHIWLATKFSGEARHVRRLRELEAIEDQHFQ